MLVYPRLPTDRALELLEDLQGLPLEDLRLRSRLKHSEAVFYTAGSAASETKLKELRDRVRAVTDELGFPTPGGRRGEGAALAFDQRLPGLLHQMMDIVPADAAAEGVWSFISLVLLPDAAAWRYPDMHPDRLTGHYRNVFRRLWWRAEVLGAGPRDAPARLGEDQLVAVMERPTIGGDRRLARSFCRAVLSKLEIQPAGRGMMLMRESAKRLIRFTPFIAMGALEQETLDQLMGEIVSRAAQAVESS
jgi:hypothetical protein